MNFTTKTVRVGGVPLEFALFNSNFAPVLNTLEITFTKTANYPTHRQQLLESGQLLELDTATTVISNDALRLLLDNRVFSHGMLTWPKLSRLLAATAARYHLNVWEAAVSSSTLFDVWEHNGQSLRVDFTETGFFNATSIAQFYNKQVSKWLKSEDTQEYIAVLLEEQNAKSKNVLLGYSDFVIVKRGGNNPGTWLHPDLAVVFSRWINVRLALWMDKKIRAILSAPTTTTKLLEQPTQSVSPLDRLVDKLDRLCDKLDTIADRLLTKM